MNWPWVSRKRYDEALDNRDKATAEIMRTMNLALDTLRGQNASAMDHLAEIKGIVGTLREELAAKRKDIEARDQHVTDLTAELRELKNQPKPAAPKSHPKLGNFVKIRDTLEAATANGLDTVHEKQEKIAKDKEAVNGH